MSSRRDFLRRTGTAAVALTLSRGGGLLSKNSEAESTPASTLAQTAQNAVIFGFPAVLMSRYLKRVLAAGLQFNRFVLDVELSTPSTKALGPNDDTLYGLAWFDLSIGPQLISVPPSHGRYYCIQLIDMWSNSFAYIGLRATGEPGGTFALTPPGWAGKLPDGVREIKSPTTRVLSFPRTFVQNDADLAAARSFQASWTTGPVSQYPHGRIGPQLTKDLKVSDVFTTIDLSGSDISLYKEIDTLIHEYPPLIEDASHAQALRPVGIDVPHYREPNAHLVPVLMGAIKPAINAIVSEQRASVSKVNGWAVDRRTKAIDHDPLARAANTLQAPGKNLPQEAIYFSLASPASGVNQYVLRFDKGHLPPVHAFWSVLLCDVKTLGFVANPINRYEIASHTTGLLYAADGSLTIAVQNVRPTASDVNWLPAPKGPFTLLMRTYLPAPAIIDGAWKPPALALL